MWLRVLLGDKARCGRQARVQLECCHSNHSKHVSSPEKNELPCKETQKPAFIVVQDAAKSISFGQVE